MNKSCLRIFIILYAFVTCHTTSATAQTERSNVSNSAGNNSSNNASNNLNSNAHNNPANKWSYAGELEQLFRIDRLPAYRSNTTVAQLSSYDRTGGNDDGFSGKYSYIRKENGKLVIADLQGPGVINRIWTPTPTRDTLQFYFDGEDQPRISIPFADLFTGNQFPFLSPICDYELGGYFCYLPIPYQKSCKIVYTGSNIQFHQIQYRTFGKEESVTSFPLSWKPEEKQALEKACSMWRNYGNNILGSVYNKASLLVEEKEMVLEPGQQKDFFSASAAGRIVGIELTPPDAFKGLNKDLLISAVWDNETVPAIYSPVADFFGFAFGTPSMESLLGGRKPDRLYNYIPMPYDGKAKLSLAYKTRKGQKQLPVTVRSKVWYLKTARDSRLEGKFYARWRRERSVALGKPYVFTEMTGKGHYIGTMLQAQGLKAGISEFFEGDDSTVVDGELRFHGTGSEDYFNGGWYLLPNRWDRAYPLPIHGCLDYNVPFSRSAGYRFFLADKIPFENNFYSSIEHGPRGNLFPADYTSLAFYYSGSPIRDIIIPDDSLRQVYVPDEYFYHRDLTRMVIGGETAVASADGYLAMTTSGEGFVRIELENIPNGEYDVLLSYDQDKEGADFSLWQRTKKLTDWISSYKPEKSFIEDSKLSRITITDLLKDITIKIRKTDTGNKLSYYWMKLKRVAE